MTAFADPVFQAYSLAVIVISLTLYGLGFITAKRRAERKQVVNSEDVSVNAGAAIADFEHPDVQRIKRAHLNLLEGAVPFFLIGLLYTFTGPSLPLARALFGIFTISRLLHAFFYLNAKQPFRTISFALGTLCSVVMIVQILRNLLPAMF